MAQRILVIPDVHGRTFWKAPVSNYLELVDRVIFLGDYLDPYEGIHPSEIYKNLLLIIKLKLENPDKVILLKGNHDEHYSSKRFRELAAGSRMDYMNWNKYHETFNEYKELFKLAHLEEVKGIPYLFSHAGLTIYWINKVNSMLWWMIDSDISVDNPEVIKMINSLDDTKEGQELLSVVGRTRSGWGEKTGSILWADVNEHPMPETPKVYGLNKVFQVFGHTRLDGSREDMVETEHFAMIDSQKCFMIDSAFTNNILKIDEYERYVKF